MQDRGLHHLYSRISGEHAEEKQLKREFESGFKKWDVQEKEAARVAKEQEKQAKRMAKEKGKNTEETEITEAEEAAVTDAENVISQEVDAEIKTIESGEEKAEILDSFENALIDSIVEG